jgi:hypothetical protein
METFARRLQQTPVEAETSRPDMRVRARIGIGEQVFMDLSPNEEPTKVASWRFSIGDAAQAAPSNPAVRPHRDRTSSFGHRRAGEVNALEKIKLRLPPRSSKRKIRSHDMVRW